MVISRVQEIGQLSGVRLSILLGLPTHLVQELNVSTTVNSH